jgi:hypothetical protein
MKLRNVRLAATPLPKGFGYASLVSAVVALLSATLNLLQLASYLSEVAVACALIAALALAYHWLPEADRQNVLSRRTVRVTAVTSIILSVFVSCAYWYGTWWVPLRELPLPLVKFLSDHWRKLDFVPALFAQLLPGSWQSGFHQYFHDTLTYCFPGPYWWESMRYLRASIPGYSLVFFTRGLVARLGAASVRRLRR